MSAFIVDYIKPELLILIPTLWLLGEIVKKTQVKKTLIPLIVGISGVCLAGLYIFSLLPSFNIRCVLSAMFASLTQGLLCAGGSVYAHEIAKNIRKNK
ncbi:MAG: hypothetical protein GX988_00290 [Clostridiales bacterium]|nr:hypothetical protein [Clostridiales bacterium]